ncbi:MAG: MFS transporter [Prevotella sp.]|nr:MFS transporter [Prevotella sp.]
MMLKVRLALMNFLEFAVWGAYLTCMGMYLGRIGMADHIGSFYAMQGFVSIFMPAVVGIVADRWIPAQRLLGLCHLVAGLAMIAAAFYAKDAGQAADFTTLFAIYSVSVAFYMPTIALSNSVAYNALTMAKMDMVKAFPPIRVFGTVGFICTMWVVDLLGFQTNYNQFFLSGGVGILLFLYTFTLPDCPVNKGKSQSMVDAFGLRAFALFRQKKMAIFFVFSALLGASLQITNGFATPYLESFASIPDYAETFGVQHSNILYSLSQISETLCILLIPFFMKRFGIKSVMLIAMFAWALRFEFLAIGNPGTGVWLFILSMIIYGVAFDFFNISGSLFVDQATEPALRSSAQGLFMMMTNGLGATVGSLVAQAVVTSRTALDGSVDWAPCWHSFALYALVVGVLFALVFRYKTEKQS